MGTAGLPEAGLRQLRAVMAGEVRAGRVPGLVFALSRGGDVHVEAIGTASSGGTAPAGGRASAGGSEPIRPDALFRITSMTRPVTAVAALHLIEEGRLALDEPIDRLLPELAGRPVLRRLDGPVENTVPAARPVTVRDLLTFRAGFGMILAPLEEYPILQAEDALDLRSVGPPTPVTPHDTGEWLRRLGTLPLMDQPGEQWRYNTSSQILGVLVARASGQPVEKFYAERIFGPLGMDDTGFAVPAGQLGRLVPCYREGADGALAPFDDGGAWSRPRVFNDGGAGLVSTAGDYLAFGEMLLGGGSYRGRRILSAELVAAMTSDQLTPRQRATADFILDGRGWGFGLSIIDPPAGSGGGSGGGAGGGAGSGVGGAPGGGPKGYGWSGGFGTTWVNDPDEDLVAVLCTQVLASPAGAAVQDAFWTATYEALGG